VSWGTGNLSFPSMAAGEERMRRRFCPMSLSSPFGEVRAREERG